MEKIESTVISSKISPKFFWLGWSVLMAICVVGIALGFWQDGRPDVISASGALIFLIIGGLYRRKTQTQHVAM
jgi:Na+/H+ antiporter NhaD/arsenite permease-like protein